MFLLFDENKFCRTFLNITFLISVDDMIDRSLAMELVMGISSGDELFNYSFY